MAFIDNGVSNFLLGFPRAMLLIGIDGEKRFELYDRAVDGCY